MAQVAQIKVGGAGTVFTFETAQVWTRESWSDPWQFRPDLFCQKCTKSVGGAIGSARIGPYRYATQGKEVKQFSTNRFQDNPPLDIDRHYVKIEWNSNTPKGDPETKVKWYGIITNQDETVLGKGLGNQTWEARTLDWLLTRKQIMTSRVESVTSPGTVYTVNRPITFNALSGGELAGLGDTSRGNRTSSLISGYYAFDNKLPGFQWTIADIADYVCQFHWPISAFDLTLDSSWDQMSWIAPRIVTEGRTMYQVLNQLSDPKRGITWSAEMNTSETALKVKLHTFANADVTLPQSGATLTANSDQRELVSAGTNHTIDVHFEMKDSQRQYEQVRVTGARKGVCRSFSFANGDLFNDWGTTQQSLYNQSSDAGNTTPEGQKNACDNNRQKASLREVYRQYRVDTFKIDADLAESNWHPGLRLSQNLPLVEYHDYSSSAQFPADNTPTGIRPNFRKMFATVELSTGVDTFRAFVEKLNANSYTESIGDGGIDFSCSVKPRNDAPAFELVTHSIPHVLGSGTFTDVSCPTEVQPQVDYRSMACTAFIERDSYVEGVWPVAAADAVNDMQSVLELSVGNRARSDYLLVGTILDIDDNGNHITAASSGFLRDDSDWLQDLARVAYEWYATPRKAAHIVLSQFTSSFPVGSMLTEIDGREINSVVTAVTWDHESGKTTIRTSFADLDFTT